MAKAAPTQKKISRGSDIRHSADLLRAKAHGTDVTLAGRAMTCAVGAGGNAGAARAFEILTQELIRALGQLGCGSFADADAPSVSPCRKTRATRNAASQPRP
jgi:isopentenyl diphosphate isomerase/L-lactate dehydrogenase-like FMN-dependent dehydrogenase